MSTQTQTESPGGKGTETSASIVWFEIPADNVERAKKFYGELFGWKIEKFPGPMEYWHIDTGGGNDTPDGGLLKRQNPGHQGITNYIGVASVDQFVAKVQKLGGKICMPRPRCLRWATSPCARTPTTIRSAFGKRIKTQNKCPESARLFVVSLNRQDSKRKGNYEHRNAERIHAPVPGHTLGQGSFSGRDPEDGGPMVRLVRTTDPAREVQSGPSAGARGQNRFRPDGSNRVRWPVCRVQGGHWRLFSAAGG